MQDYFLQTGAADSRFTHLFSQIKIMFFTGGGVLLSLFLIHALASNSIVPLPPYAQVYVDDAAKTYHSPLHMGDNPDRDWKDVRLVRASEAHALEYKADDDCQVRGYFLDDRGPMVWQWLEDAGIINLEHRWGLDGTWNY